MAAPEDDALMMAIRHVARARRIVLQQARLIERLKALGIDAAHAEQTLAIFENNLKIFEYHRDLLVRRDAPRNFTVVGTALTPTGPAARPSPQVFETQRGTVEFCLFSAPNPPQPRALPLARLDF
jgi:hypothetical protein